MDPGVYLSHSIRRIQWEESADKAKHLDTVNTKALSSQQYHPPPAPCECDVIPFVQPHM